MSLLATLAQEFRVASPNFDKFEFRIQESGIYSAFRRQTDAVSSFITPELAQRAFASMGHTTKLPVINYKDVTIRSTRPVTIAADENTSAFYTVTWTTLAYGFKMYPALFHNNDIGYQTDFNKKFQAFLVKLSSTLEGLGLTALDAAKSQVINTVTGGHTYASNVVSETGIGNLKDSYILADLAPMMRSNSFMTFDMDVVGNHGLDAILRRMDGFGEFNQENKTLPYAGKNFHFSNSITNAAGKNATGFACVDGSLGLLTRVEVDSLFNTTSETGHEWGTVTLPGLDLTVGTYSYPEVVDASTVAGAASAHLTRTKAEVFDFAVDIAFVTSYNSDLASIPSPVLKFDIDTD